MMIDDDGMLSLKGYQNTTTHAPPVISFISADELGNLEGLGRLTVQLCRYGMDGRCGRDRKAPRLVTVRPSSLVGVAGVDQRRSLS